MTTEKKDPRATPEHGEKVKAGKLKAGDKKRQRGRPRKKELPPATSEDGSYQLMNTNSRNFRVADKWMPTYNAIIAAKDIYYREINKLTRTVREIIDEIRHDPDKYRHGLSQSFNSLWEIANVETPTDMDVRVLFDEPGVLNIVVRQEPFNEQSDFLDRPLPCIEHDFPLGMRNPAKETLKEQARAKRVAAKKAEKAALTAAEMEEERRIAEEEHSRKELDRINDEKNYT